MEIDIKLLENLAAALASPDEIARCVGMKRAELSAKLKEETGETLVQFVKKERWKQRYELRMTEKELAKKSEKMALFLEECFAAAEDVKKPTAAKRGGALVRRAYVEPRGELKPDEDEAPG